MGRQRGDVQWVWEERRDGSSDWEEETEVITTQVPPPGQRCITPHSSTLTRKLTRRDDNAVFRCYTVNNYTNTSYVEFAAIIKTRDFLGEFMKLVRFLVYLFVLVNQ